VARNARLKHRVKQAQRVNAWPTASASPSNARDRDPLGIGSWRRKVPMIGVAILSMRVNPDAPNKLDHAAVGIARLHMANLLERWLHGARPQHPLAAHRPPSSSREKTDVRDPLLTQHCRRSTR